MQRYLYRFRLTFPLLALMLASGVGVGVGVGVDVARAAVPVPRVESVTLSLVRRIPHSTDDYCQGLTCVRDPESGLDTFYESTGRYGQSLVKRYHLETESDSRAVPLARRFFGEGNAVVGNRLFVLTWRESTCLVFDTTTLRQIDEFRYRNEGWGLAYDGTSLVMSDGSAALRFIHPDGFAEHKRVKVWFQHEGKKVPLANINELEVIDGVIWANVYGSTVIVRIDPRSGKVVQTIDCSALVPENLRGNIDLVLNGIAWNPVKRLLYLTGKCWPEIFEFSLEYKSDTK